MTHSSRAVIYTRVSTNRQAEEGTSLEVQEAACLRKAQDLEAEVVDIVSDEGVSGACCFALSFFAFVGCRAQDHAGG